MKFYALERVDGGVDVIQAVDDTPPATQIAKWRPDRQAEVTGAYTEIAEDEYRAHGAVDPQCIFRRSWRFNGTLQFDMPEALKCALDFVRAARAPLIAAQDVAFTRAQGAKNQTAADAAEAKRQALRDATADARLTGAQSLAELKAAMQAVIDDMKAL